MTIGTKFFASTTLVLAIVSLFIFIYYPKQYKEMVFNTLETQVKSMAESVALGVAIGRKTRNFKKIHEALNWVKKDSSVNFIVVYDKSKSPYAFYNPANLPLENSIENHQAVFFDTHGMLNVFVPVSLNGQDYGSLQVGYSLDKLSQALSKNRDVTLIVCFGIMLLGMGLSKLISMRITGPLRQLTETANEISEGNMYVQPNVDSRDEVGDLAHAMHVMLKKNEEAMHEIQGINVQLERARQEALKTSKAKSDFLSQMSHELRTPMNAILGFAQLLKYDPDSSKSLLDMRVDKIVKAGNHLLNLVNEVLELSVIESGKLTLSREDVSLNLLCAEVFDLMDPLAQEYGIALENHLVKDSELFVYADRGRLRQVLLNLLSNAIKYNRENGNCVVSTHKTEPNGSAGEFIAIQIKDSGIGISQNKLKMLYTPFERFHPEAIDIEGTGIGLAITKKLVEAMGGKIEVESTEGQGTCFTILMQVGTKTTVPEKEIPLQKLPGKESEISDGSKYKLLYIEDNPDNVELVEQILSSIPNLSVISASRAQLGIDLARGHQPDIILMDINLPEMDGISALKKLKGIEETRNIPVFALSALAMKSDIEKAKKAGFDCYITKPIQVIPFLQKVKEALSLETDPAMKGSSQIEEG